MYSSYDYLWSGIVQSVQRLPTAWTVPGSNSVEVRFSASFLNDYGASPAFCTIGSGSFPRVKLLERGVYQPTNVKERAETYLFHPSVPSRQVTG